MDYNEQDLKLLNDEGQENTDLEEVKSVLHTLVKDFENEEQSLRYDLLQEIRKNDLFFRGESPTWDEVNRSWLTRLEAYRDGVINEDEFTIEPKTVNIVRAHGESIIAASSVEVPKVHYFPSDASKPQDVTTARAYGKIERLISLHNDSKELIRQTFFILWKEHFAAAYVRAHQDKKYGVIYQDVYQPVERQEMQNVCPECSTQMPEVEAAQPAEVQPEVEPLEGQVDPMEGSPMDIDMDSQYAALGQELGIQAPQTCPTCEMPVIPQQKPVSIMDQQKVGEEAIIKCGVKIEIYGPKNVKIPFAAKRIEDCPFLIFEREVHEAALLEEFPDIEDKLGVSNEEGMERRSRLPGLSGTAFRSWPTLKLVWIRPWVFSLLRKLQPEIYKHLRSKYPDGALLTVVNNNPIECENSALDDHWHITRSTLSDTLHADPVCKPLIPVQELKTETIELIVETLRHAISQMWADPAVVDFDAYGKQEVTPGMMNPARPRPGQNLDQSFFEQRGATLSQYASQWSAELEAAGQFVVGAFPSIYGGRQEAGSKTASEYETSRQQALQRIGLPWEMVNSWWPGVMGKAIKLYRANFQGQDHFVESTGGGYRNVEITEEDLQGEIGNILPESSSGFPTSWSEKRVILFNMLGQKLPAVEATVFHPENATTVKDLFGFFDFYVPGENDRHKQLEEITELLKSKPIMPMPEVDPATGQPLPPNPAAPPQAPQPTIHIDQDIDDHAVHVQAIRAWATSDTGRRVRNENPDGWANVMAHLSEHLVIVNMQAQQQAEAEAEGGEGNAEGN